jgi:hypothetical protein
LRQPEAARYAVSEAFPVRGKELFHQAEETVTSKAELGAFTQRFFRVAAKKYDPSVAIVKARYRMIVSRTTGAVALYDRVADPGELDNLADSEPGVVQELTEDLRAWHRRMAQKVYCTSIV